MGCTLKIACAKGGTLNFKQQKNLSFFRKKKRIKNLVTKCYGYFLKISGKPMGNFETKMKWCRNHNFMSMKSWLFAQFAYIYVANIAWAVHLQQLKWITLNAQRLLQLENEKNLNARRLSSWNEKEMSVKLFKRCTIFCSPCIWHFLHFCLIKMRIFSN